MAAPVLIAGGGALAAAIERRLRAGGAAVAHLESESENDGACDAAALVIAADDDGGNVDLALRMHRSCPSLPLVVRLFDATLVAYLRESVPGVTVLSMSAVAAPAFVEAARRAIAGQPEPRRERVLRPGRRAFRVDPILVTALVSLFLLVFPSALFFSHALDLPYMDALYFVWTTVMTVGYGDISLKDAGLGAKLVGMAIMLAGAAFIAVLFALLSDWVLTRRLDLLRGRTRVRGSGHIVIAGAGNMGLRVARLLEGEGRKLVIVERDAEARNVEALRTDGHHVIIANAKADETFALARVEQAALVMAVTDSDAANLEVALRARAYGVPTVIRLLSPELSQHVCERGDAVALSPVAAAVEAFVEAALKSR